MNMPPTPICNILAKLFILPEYFITAAQHHVGKPVDFIGRPQRSSGIAVSVALFVGRLQFAFCCLIHTQLYIYFVVFIKMIVTINNPKTKIAPFST